MITFTIRLDDDTACWARTEAARQDVSVSRYLADVLAERRRQAEGYEAAGASFMSRESPPLRNSGDTLPARDDLHERPCSRS